MNIFFLSLVHSHSRNARYHCDKHCVKMILEITQLLWTAWHCYQESLGTSETLAERVAHDDPSVKVYRKTHVNHPMAIWVRRATPNYLYAVSLGLALCGEYTHRYKKVHTCHAYLEWLALHPPGPTHTDYKEGTYLATRTNPVGCTPVPLCMNVEYKSPSLVHSYRKYYQQAKSEIVQWKVRGEPIWWKVKH
jgi:hypothetical protein